MNPARIKGVLLDLSGTLHIGPEALPGAVEAVHRLRRTGLKVRFVTNTSRQSRRMLLERLQRIGLDISPEHLFTAPFAVHEYLRERQLRPFLIVHPNLEEDFSDLPRENPDAVVLGDAGEAFCYERLNAAFRLLLDGAPLLSVGDNRYFRESDGLSLDVGPFVRALEFAAGKKVIVLGKPSSGFFHRAVTDLGCRPDETVMVGDDVESDVNGALAAGLQGVLVRTGKYRPGDDVAISGGTVLENIGTAVEWILEQA